MVASRHSDPAASDFVILLAGPTRMMLSWSKSVPNLSGSKALFCQAMSELIPSAFDVSKESTQSLLFRDRSDFLRDQIQYVRLINLPKIVLVSLLVAIHAHYLFLL